MSNQDTIAWGPTARRTDPHQFEAGTNPRWCRHCGTIEDAYQHASEAERAAFDEQQRTAEPRTMPKHVLQMTGQPRHLEYAEILTDAGIIRVNVGQVDTRTGRPVVVVEVEPNRSPDWMTTVREHMSRVDVRIERMV